MAQPRTVYHIVPNPRGGWGVKKEGAKNFSRTFDTKAPARKWAKKTAKNNEPSEAIEHGKDGKIMDRSTYKDDPLPPKG